jgi:hypothetical protein
MQFRIQLTKSCGEEDGKVSAKRHRISAKKRCADLRRNRRVQHAKWRGGLAYQRRNGSMSASWFMK